MKKSEKKKEKQRRTYRSADIAKAGEDTSGDSAQKESGRTAGEGRRNIPMHGAP